MLKYSMPPSTTFDEPPEFHIGDRVVTTGRVGRLGHGLARGTPGVVVALTTDGLIAVRFDAGRIEHVHPGDLQLDPADG
jgi:hypothetical protein